MARPSEVTNMDWVFGDRVHLGKMKSGDWMVVLAVQECGRTHYPEVCPSAVK